MTSGANSMDKLGYCTGINEAAEKVDLSDDRFCPNGTKIATAVVALH